MSPSATEAWIHTCCHSQSTLAGHLQSLQVSEGTRGKRVQWGEAQDTAPTGAQTEGTWAGTARPWSSESEGYALCLLAPSRWRFMSLITLPLTKPQAHRLTNTVGNVSGQKSHIIRTITRHPAYIRQRAIPSGCPSL